MNSCLLCPSPAELDALCTPCGAKKWAADAVLTRPADDVAYLRAYPGTSELWAPRRRALRELPTPEAARAFLDRLDGARKAREAAPVCSRGCTSHEEDT